MTICHSEGAERPKNLVGNEKTRSFANAQDDIMTQSDCERFLRSNLLKTAQPVPSGARNPVARGCWFASSLRSSQPLTLLAVTRLLPRAELLQIMDMDKGGD